MEDKNSSESKEEILIALRKNMNIALYNTWHQQRLKEAGSKSANPEF